MDKSLMDRMNNKEEATDTSEDKLMEMWDMLDDGQKQDILSQMEKMCNYSEDSEGEEPKEDMNHKGGVAIVIQAKK